jgi:transcriptional regulator with XRE-family HTH domain
MATQARSTFRRRQLGRELRRLRAEAGLTQGEAARLLHYHGSLISRYERGYQVPGYHDLRAILDQYAVPVDDWQPYLDMGAKARAKGWYTQYGIGDYNYVSMEDEASLLREILPGYVPGLLQTTDYAQTVFDLWNPPLPKSMITAHLAIRERRQKRLTAADPIRLHAVLDETVLRRNMPPNVMKDQLNHLMMLSELENVTIQVIVDLQVHSGLAGYFALLSFPHKDEQDIGYLEHIAGWLIINKKDQVDRCKLAFEQLTRKALSHNESVRLIERLADEA